MAVHKKPFISDKLARRRKAESKAKRIIGLSVFVILIGAAGYLVFGSRFQIKDVMVSGTKALSAETIQAAAANTIAGNSLLIFPKHNIFLYSRQSVRENLAKDF